MGNDLSEKDELIKSVFQNYRNPSFNLQKESANKNLQGNKSYSSFTNNSHNEMLNNSKSEINCRDNVQTNNKVESMSNRVSENPVIVQIRIILEMKIISN